MMNRITAMLVAAGLITGTMLMAQENGKRNRNQNRGSRAPMQMTAEMSRKWSDIQAQLKKKYPEKFAEIEKLAQTNLAEAMQKLVQLAREAKIATPMQPRGRGGFGGRDGQRGERAEGFGQNGGFRGRAEGFGQRGGMGMPGARRAEAENQIKAKFPKEYEAIEKSREQAEEQLQALAGKAGVKLPPTPEAAMKKLAAIREKYKTEFDEIRKLRESDPKAAMERTMEIFQREGMEMPMMNFRRPDGHRNLPAQTRRGNPMQDMRKKLDLLRKTYPDEMKKIQGLRTDDPQKFREELKKLSDRYDREHPKK